MTAQSDTQLKVNDVVTLKGRIVESDGVSGRYRIELLDINNDKGFPSENITVDTKYIHEFQQKPKTKFDVDFNWQNWSTVIEDNDINKNDTINTKVSISKCKLLIDGYIRVNIESYLNNLYNTIPLGIINKCHQFFVQNTYFVAWTKQQQYHDRFSIAISTTTNYSNVHKLEIEELNKNKLFMQKPEITPCFSTNINLPEWIINKYASKIKYSQYKKYHYLIQCGRNWKRNSFGDQEPEHPDCDIIIIDDNELNIGYHLSLPICDELLTHSTSIYNDTNHTIYSVNGWSDVGDPGSDDRICSLNLDTLQWDTNTLKTKVPRQATSLCVIPSNYNSNRLCVIGGFAPQYSSTNKVELITLDDNNQKIEHKYLGDLNYGRENLSSLYIEEINKIIVGGGTSMQYDRFNVGDQSKLISNSIEIYDFNKNEWYLYPYSTHLIHDNQCALWYDNINPNIIYFDGEISTKYGMTFNHDQEIEFIDLRDYKIHKENKWNKLQNKSISLFQNFNTNFYRNIITSTT